MVERTGCEEKLQPREGREEGGTEALAGPHRHEDVRPHQAIIQLFSLYRTSLIPGDE